MVIIARIKDDAYVSSRSSGSGTSRMSDDVTTLFGRDCQVAAPGAKSAVSDYILCHTFVTVFVVNVCYTFGLFNNLIVL